VAGSEATIMTAIVMAVSTAHLIEHGNTSGTIETPVITRRKGANGGQSPPCLDPHIERTSGPLSGVLIRF
jgi:hypothetical protein